MSCERTDFEVSYAVFEGEALGIIGGDRQRALAWLAELSAHVDRVIAGTELERVADWSARLDRLAASLPGGEAGALAAGYLTATLERLDRRAAALAQQRDAAEREEIGGGARELLHP
jgi:hypothetical protein